MAWMACRSCSALFAVGLLRCPQCSAVSELFAVPEEVVEAEQEQENMPKISVEGGPSNAAEVPGEPEIGTETEAPVEGSATADEQVADSEVTTAEDAVPDAVGEVPDAAPAAPAKPATAKATKKAATKP